MATSDKDKARLLAGAAEAKTKSPSMGPAQPVVGIGSLFSNLARGIEWAEEKTEPLVAPLREHVLNPYIAYPLAKFTREHRLAGAPPGEPTQEEVEKGSKMLFSPLDVLLPGAAKAAGVAGLAGLTLQTIKSKRDLLNRVDEFTKMAAEAYQRGDRAGFDEIWEAVYGLGDVAKRRNFQGAQEHIDAALGKLNELHNIRIKEEFATPPKPVGRRVKSDREIALATIHDQAKAAGISMRRDARDAVLFGDVGHLEQLMEATTDPQKKAMFAQALKVARGEVVAAPTAPQVMAGAAEAQAASNVAPAPTVDEAEAMARALGEKPKRKGKTQEELDELALQMMGGGRTTQKMRAGAAEARSLGPSPEAAAVIPKTIEEMTKFVTGLADEEYVKTINRQALSTIVLGEEPLQLATLAQLAGRLGKVERAWPGTTPGRIVYNRVPNLRMPGDIDQPLGSDALGATSQGIPSDPLRWLSRQALALAQSTAKRGPHAQRFARERELPSSEEHLLELVQQRWGGAFGVDASGRYRMPQAMQLSIVPTKISSPMAQFLETTPEKLFTQTLAHEVGHALMGVRDPDAIWAIVQGLVPSEYWLTEVMPELVNLSKEARPILWKSTNFNFRLYLESTPELLADGLSQVMLRPQESTRVAPKFVEILRTILLKGHETQFKARGIDMKTMYPLLAAGLAAATGKAVYPAGREG